MLSNSGATKLKYWKYTDRFLKKGRKLYAWEPFCSPVPRMSGQPFAVKSFPNLAQPNHLLCLYPSQDLFLNPGIMVLALAWSAWLQEHLGKDTVPCHSVDCWFLGQCSEKQCTLT